jgi:hypothetical protein
LNSVRSSADLEWNPLPIITNQAGNCNEEKNEEAAATGGFLGVGELVEAKKTDEKKDIEESEEETYEQSPSSSPESEVIAFPESPLSPILVNLDFCPNSGSRRTATPFVQPHIVDDHTVIVVNELLLEVELLTKVHVLESGHRKLSPKTGKWTETGICSVFLFNFDIHLIS